MVNYTYADLFKQDNVKKDIIIDFGDFQITNNRLYSEAFELSESLCSQNELHFGCCESSVVKFKCRNEFGELKNKWFDVSMALNGNMGEPLKIGSYRVFDSKPSGDRLYTNITAYDAMYGLINAEMINWYESLMFPITLKEFRDSFFSYFDVMQSEKELINDDILIEKTINADSISGKRIITAICELNGEFGHINRQGEFTYISLADKVGLYPTIELYPSNALLPINGPYDMETEALTKSKYISCEHEDFNTNYIGKLQIRQEQNDIGVVVGNGTNTYIVQDNFLVYGKSTEELTVIANKLFEKIKSVQYRPFKLAMRGNLCLEVGDSIVVNAKYKTVESYVLERNMKGIQALRDTIESKGVYEYEEKVNATNKEVRQLRGKVNILERTVEQTVAKVADVETKMSTTVTQNIEGLKVEIEKSINDICDLKTEVEENAKSVNKTAYEFNTEDLTIKKTGSEMETHISEDGMIVKKSGKDVLTANNKGVDATNLRATTYLIVGENSRLEDYGDNRTGCFWIGG